MTEKTLVRCASHRARQKLFRLLPEEPQGFYSWQTRATGGFYEIPSNRVPDALKITGITKASSKFKYSQCWPKEARGLL
jgi:hypothetical protein